MPEVSIFLFLDYNIINIHAEQMDEPTQSLRQTTQFASCYTSKTSGDDRQGRERAELAGEHYAPDE